MNAVEYSLRILDELRETLVRVDAAGCEEIVLRILKAKRVYVAGGGRSLLMLKSFAMRLMHLGLEVYVVGETVTPAIVTGDLLLFGSGSGETGSLVSMARKAKELGVTIALITIFPQSSIAGMARSVVQIAAPTSKAVSGYASIQPGGSCFEQSMLMLLDAIVIRLAEELKVDANAGIGLRHANIE
jgi:6-phospho-3-hexuloisomerase